MANNSSVANKNGSRYARILLKAQKHLEEGRFYEGHQLYVSLHNRLMGKRQFSEAIGMASTGVFKLLEHSQGNSASELALLMLDAFRRADQRPSPNVIATLLRIFRAFPPDSATAQAAFMRDAIKWSRECTSDKDSGHPGLHLAFAQDLTAKRLFADAQVHWLRSEAPQEHAKALAEWSRSGFLDERDLYITRAVLQQCCLQNLQAANVLLSTYSTIMAKEPKNTDGSAALDTPLMSFVRFLLRTLEREARPLFEMLRARYAKALQRDASLERFLDRIGELYFNIPANKGLIGDVLAMMQG